MNIPIVSIPTWMRQKLLISISIKYSWHITSIKPVYTGFFYGIFLNCANVPGALDISFCRYNERCNISANFSGLFLSAVLKPFKVCNCQIDRLFGANAQKNDCWTTWGLQGSTHMNHWTKYGEQTDMTWHWLAKPFCNQLQENFVHLNEGR